MLDLTIEENRQKLLDMGVSAEAIDNFIAFADPLQKYNFEYIGGKISLKKIDYSQLAEYFITKYKICTVLKSLHIYEDGLYKYLSDDTFDKIAISELYNSKINGRKELRRYIAAQCTDKLPSPERYILFLNGVYDVEEDKLLPRSPDYVFCNIIPHCYNPDAKKQQFFDDFIKSLVCGDEEAAELLIQMIGYCFYRKNPLQEFLFMLGPGGNGKSTLLSFIAYVIGIDNISYLTLEDMENEFNLVLMKNKLLNIGDDVDIDYMQKVGILKKVVSGESFLAGGKYKDKEPMSFYGKTMFSGNDIPKMKDKSEGIMRRLNILPMFNKFKSINGVNANCDTKILDKLKTPQVAEYCIYKSMQALRKVLADNQFVRPKSVENARLEFEMSNNHILEFIEDHQDILLTKEAGTIYKTFYKNFCNDCGYKPLGRNEFYKRMYAAGFRKVQADNIPGRPRMFIKSR